MAKSWIREKKYQCGEEYMTVSAYAVTDQEHRHRGKKRKESSRSQKERNKHASMRRYQRKVLANFDEEGFYVTGTYNDENRPESFADCVKDVRNYERRVKAATKKRFGERARRVKLSLNAARNGEKGKLHMHGFAECKGLTAAERREWREMLEDLWRRRVPGTNEFEPLGTLNADRIDMQKILGVDGQGKNGTVGYIYGHKEHSCIETRNLTLPEELQAADTKWSRRQLRQGCTEHAEDPRWWEQRFPGWEVVQVMIYDPQQLHETEKPRPEGWESTEPQVYLILRRKGLASAGFAKVRT